MRKIFTSSLFVTAVFLILNIANIAISQDCSTHVSIGYPPINDLGPGIFHGMQGGLYPGGSNTRPSSHNSAGILLAHQVLPLDTNGIYNPSTGKIVLLSIGMSNCLIEFQAFMTVSAGLININPKLVLVNGAQNGQTIDSILNPSAAFWSVVASQLHASGVSIKQVQVIWFKEAEKSPTDTSFPGYSVSLKNKFKPAMGLMKSKYPNLKLCYLASRIYAGYANSILNPEPYAYYSGWSVKWLVEDQITGDTALTYSGASPKSPWLSWGPYLWADGIIPRSDGLTWICPGDFISDGTHPSLAGCNKVAVRLVNFFATDATSKPWFLKNTVLHLTISIQGLLNVVDNNLKLRDTVRLYLRSISAPFAIVDSSASVIDTLSFKGSYDFYNVQSGTYYIQTKHRNSIETWSKPGGESFTAGNAYEYNFTNSALMAYGGNLIFYGNKYNIYSGDVAYNGIVDLNDIVACFNSAAVFSNGYQQSDVTGDNIVNLNDVILVYNNAGSFVRKITP